MPNRANWSWDNLRYFLAVAEFGTLSDAARRLGVSHSTVQRRITAFEQELQVSLFNRKAQGYGLTAAGKALFQEAAQMQHTLESISRKISGSDAEVSGEVVITSTDTLSFLILPSLIGALSQRYPRLQLTLNMMNSFSDVQNLEADIAVRTCNEPPANLIGRKIGQIEFAACASVAYCREHGLSSFPEDSSGHRFIMLDASYSGTPFYQWLEQHIGEKSSVTVASGFLSGYALCQANLGITLLPSYILDKQSNLQRLETGGDAICNSIWILSHADLRDTERVRVVRQFLYEKLTAIFANEITLGEGARDSVIRAGL